jgi:alkylhydroperoxidase family enzyme
MLTKNQEGMKGEMARVKILDKDQVSLEFQERFQKMEESGRPVLNFFKVMAHSPQVGHRFLQLGTAILLKGVVPPNLRELAILRVGQLNQATYEWTQHVPIALRVGVRQAQIDALPKWEDSLEFDEREKAILRYTDEETKNIRVKDETFATVRAILTEEGVVELTTTIGYYGMVCRILEALEVELE